MRTDWSVECLIHGDVRWDNCLLASGRSRRLYVIDWELAVYGDPWWDIGAMLAEHVGFWLQSIPISADDDPGHDLSAAGYPLHKLTRSASVFWSTYVSARRLDEQARSAALWRTTRYAAARLIQSAFEWANTTSMLSNHSILAVQLAENIVTNPRAAAATLFGVVDEPDLAS
jgi:aminoglycoside phosphotransferase (APT) family kinase protein